MVWLRYERSPLSPTALLADVRVRCEHRPPKERATGRPSRRHTPDQLRFAANLRRRDPRASKVRSPSRMTSLSLAYSPVATFSRTKLSHLVRKCDAELLG